MHLPAARRRRDVLFITLIDLLLQILFLFLLAFLWISQQNNSEFLGQAKRLAERTGLSLPEIEEAWSRLVDPLTLDRKYQEFLRQKTDYERLKALEKQFAEQAKGLREKNEALLAQLDYLRKKARALGDPPCWLNAQNQVEFLFQITILDEGVLVVPAWPQSRNKDVKQIRVPEKSLNRNITVGEFQRDFRGIYDWSSNASCRHYVSLANQAKSGDKSTENRSAVEGYFYVLLRRK